MQSKFVIPRSGMLNDHSKHLTFINAIAIADNIYKKNEYYSNSIKNIMAVFVCNGFYESSDIFIGCISNLEPYYEMIDFLKFHFAMKAIESQLTNYERLIKNLISKYYDNDKDIPVYYSDYGIICSMPKMYKEVKERVYFEEKLYTVRPNSKYVGEIKKRDNYKVELLSKRWISSRECWVINVIHDETNFITYFDSRDDIKDVNVGEFFKIRATIKRHQYSEYVKCNETQLTRVAYS